MATCNAILKNGVIRKNVSYFSYYLLLRLLNLVLNQGLDICLSSDGKRGKLSNLHIHGY